MHFTSMVASSALLAASTMAQSPPNYSPGSSCTLGVNFGNTYLTANESLPQALVDSVNPSAFSPGVYLKEYLLLLVDLVIPDEFVPGTNLVPGLGANRTTRLHWFQGGVTHNLLNGSFTYNTSAYAPYAGPQPPQGDIPHDYVFYLFNQPSGFVPPPAALVAEWQDGGSSARFNYSLSALAAQVGNPIAANYMQVQSSLNAGAVTSAPTSTYAAAELAVAKKLLIEPGCGLSA